MRSCIDCFYCYQYIDKKLGCICICPFPAWLFHISIKASDLVIENVYIANDCRCYKEKEKE